MLTIIKYLFRILPWWLWVVIAVISSPGGFKYGAETLHEAYQFEKARSEPIPRAVSPADFIPARDVAAWGGVVLAGAVPVMERIAPIPGDSSDRLYALAADPSGQHLIALIGREADAEELAQVLENLLQPEARLSGVYREPEAHQTLHRLLRGTLDRIVAGDYSLIVIEPFANGWDAGLKYQRNLMLFVGVMLLGLALMPILFAWLGWRRAQRRKEDGPSKGRQHKPRAKPPAASPWGGDAPPPVSEAPKARVGHRRTRKNDGFDDGPIKSRRGGFWR